MGKHPVTHFEFTAKDPKKLGDFYRTVFGWKLTDGPADYAMVDTQANDVGIAGGIGQSRDGRGMLTVYIEANDLNEALANVEKAGGRTILAPQRAGPVTVALFTDPEGNVVGLANGM